MKQVKGKNNEKGVAFVVLLIVIFFLSMISISYLFMSHTQQGKSYKQEQTITALPTAEAGMERAIWCLMNNIGEIPTPSNPIKKDTGVINKKSSFEVEIQFVSREEMKGSTIYKIISTGEERLFSHTEHQKIEALVRVGTVTEDVEIDGSVVCDSNIDWRGNIRTDSYDSSNGAYTPDSDTNNGNEGNITTNGDILLGGSAYIDGDAHCGPGDSIIGEEGRVRGTIEEMKEEILFPPVVVPVVDDSHKLGLIDIKQNSITLTDGTYTCTGITISGQKELIIKGNVNLYCISGDIDATGGGGINVLDNNYDATKFHLYCTTNVTSVKIAGNDKFFGTIYAPNATVEVKGDGNVFGQVVSKKVTFNGNAKIIYDEQLKNSDWLKLKKEYKKANIISWREVAL